jgi:hypothetical protein
MMPKVNWRVARNDRQVQAQPSAEVVQLEAVGAGKGNGNRPAKRAAGYSKR